ncbi:MAG TPA: hypothetical protein VES20_11370, partial [Bryobacteraceae bacterium]|nr:hypothetical protein [Bryobacteraceae bacterium]
MAAAQVDFRPEWRRIGTGVLDLGLASSAGGPVDRVWYSADGETLLARGETSGKIWSTADGERWSIAA